MAGVAALGALAALGAAGLAAAAPPAIAAMMSPFVTVPFGPVAVTLATSKPGCSASKRRTDGQTRVLSPELRRSNNAGAAAA